MVTPTLPYWRVINDYSGLSKVFKEDSQRDSSEVIRKIFLLLSDDNKYKVSFKHLKKNIGKFWDVFKK